jgi:diguanylate cyclase
LCSPERFTLQSGGSVASLVSRRPALAREPKPSLKLNFTNAVKLVVTNCRYVAGFEGVFEAMMRLKIENKADIVRFTLLGTALAVIVPVIVVASLLNPLREVSPQHYQGVVIAAGLIPLLVTPPIAALLLHSMLMLKQTIERIDDHVKFDGLTGILNRSHFLDSVRATRVNGMMLIVDADHFKAVNDDLGHDAGDEALKVLASRIAAAVGSDGLVGRLGGEEFGVFLPDQMHEAGAQMASLICDHVRKSLVPVGDVRMRMTVSIGGALHCESAPLGHSLKLADQRLYQAKNAGRDRYVIEEKGGVVIRPPALKTVNA